MEGESVLLGNQVVKNVQLLTFVRCTRTKDYKTMQSGDEVIVKIQAIGELHKYLEIRYCV